jgi:type IV pilus assembly protein PilA
MKVRRLLKGFRHGERGFTLIELLVVVAILGILAAVIVPNIAGFIGEGKVEAANTEAHNVETAVVAYLVDNDLIDFDLAVGPATSNGPEAYLTNPATLQATYTFTDNNISAVADTGGNSVTDAAAAQAGKWTGLFWNSTSGWHE